MGQLSDIATQIEQQTLESLVLNLDSTWWELRGVFDKYIESSTDKIDALYNMTSLLHRYTSAECALEYPEVLASFWHARRVGSEADAAMKDTWQRAVQHFGLLVAKVVDGNAFTHLARADLLSVDHRRTPLPQKNGTSLLSVERICNSENATDADAVRQLLGQGLESGLYKQTVDQLGVLVAEINALEARFRYAGLGEPPQLQTVIDSSKRLDQALGESFFELHRLTDEATTGLRKQLC